MPHKNLALNNKNSGMFFQKYLDNINEPEDSGFSNESLGPRNELSSDSYIMRRRFRLIAKTLRDHF